MNGHIFIPGYIYSIINNSLQDMLIYVQIMVTFYAMVDFVGASFKTKVSMFQT